jgi:hypothetical protein
MTIYNILRDKVTDETDICRRDIHINGLANGNGCSQVTLIFRLKLDDKNKSRLSYIFGVEWYSVKIA